jgi:hypothetical protein
MKAQVMRVRKARKRSVYPACSAPVLVGQRIARREGAWIHLACVPAVAACLAELRRSAI